MVSDKTIKAVAEAIAERANECCHRSDGFEKGIAEFAKEQIEAYEKASIKEMTVKEAISWFVPLIEEQSCGEWDSKTIKTDAEFFAKALAKLGTIRIVGGGEDGKS